MGLTKTNLYYYYYRNKIIALVSKPKLIPFYIDRLLKYSKTDSFDVLLVSYPKSGRTWLQNLLVEIGKLGFDPDNEIDEQTSISDALTKLGEDKNDFPYILATHAKSSWEQVEPLHDEEQIQKEDFEEFGKKKVIYLYRDPRDVLVSQYYHIKLRNNISKIEKEDLINNKVIGIKKIIFFMNKWMEYSEKHKDQIFRMSYEEMKKDTIGTLKKMNQFIGMPVSDEIIQKAIEQSDIKKMQKKQASSTNKDPWTQTNKPSNINSFQSRKGITGEHKEFFSKEQLSKINQIIDEFLDKRYNY